MNLFKSLKIVLTHPNNRGHILRAIRTVAWWKLNQIFFHLPTVVEIAPNVRIVCDPSSSYGSFIVYARWPEYAELNFIYNFLESGDNYIDVGAHIGDSSLLAASKVGKGRVLACEPTPKVYEELCTNIRLNNFEAIIEPLPMAISNQVGTAFFALESASEVNHLSTGRRHGKTIKVDTTTIDALVKKFKLSQVDLLKIDVEGFELEVVEGSKKTMAKLGALIFEVNPRSADIEIKAAKIEEILRAQAFELFQFSDDVFLREVDHISVMPTTVNYLAVSPEVRKSRRFKKWLK